MLPPSKTAHMECNTTLNDGEEKNAVRCQYLAIASTVLWLAASSWQRLCFTPQAFAVLLSVQPEISLVVHVQQLSLLAFCSFILRLLS